VAGAVEHIAAHPVGQAAGQDHGDGERLAAAALGVDEHGAVVVGGVERVEQLDGAARLGEGERDPGRRAAAGADQRQAVADVAGDVLARQPGHVAAQGQRGLPQLGLAQLALVDAGVGGRCELARGLFDRLRQLDRVGFGAAFADRLVDRQLVDGGALRAGQLLEQLGGLLLLGQHLVVRRPAPQFGAAVDAEQPAVARLVAGPLAQPVQRVHVHAQGERAGDLHRLEQPAEVGGVRRCGDVDGLLEVAIDAQLALAVGGVRRAGDQLAQPERGQGRLARVLGDVELAEHLEPRLPRRGSPLGCPVGGGGVEAPPEQVGYLGAGQQARG
jgi:hypothetical protein